MTKSLPNSPSLKHLKNEAREILKAHNAQNVSCCETLRNLRRFEDRSEAHILDSDVKLADVQYALALDYGFDSWASLKDHVTDLEQHASGGTPGVYRKPADDLYDCDEPPIGLDEAQRDLVMSVCPPGSQIVGLEPFVPGWSRYPITTVVRLPSGEQQRLLLQMTQDRGMCEIEVAVTSVLRDAGLPVPELLSEPVRHPQNHGTMVLTSKPPGQPLLFLKSPADELDRTCEIILEVVALYEDMTARIQADPRTRTVLPVQSLQSELDELEMSAGAWRKEGIFADALERLRPIVEEVDTPLVFTNGNVNSWHCLSQNGQLSGLCNFGLSRIEDPLMGFTKFRLWERDIGWAPFKRVGIIERYLYARNMTQSDFSIRLALACLQVLSRDEVPVSDDGSEFRTWFFEVLSRSVASLPVAVT